MIVNKSDSSIKHFCVARRKNLSSGLSIGGDEATMRGEQDRHSQLDGDYGRTAMDLKPSERGLDQRRARINARGGESTYSKSTLRRP